MIPQLKALTLRIFGAGKFESVVSSGELWSHLPQKDIEKKVNLTEQSQKAKKDFFYSRNSFRTEKDCALITQQNFRNFAG